MLWKVSCNVHKTYLTNVARFQYTTQTVPKTEGDGDVNSAISREEWTSAKPFEEIPGPSRLMSFFSSFIAKYTTSSVQDAYKMMYKTYGPITLMRGSFGRPSIVSVSEPEAFEKIFRTEGIWPIRDAIQSSLEYRKNIRPDVYKDFPGLTVTQGKEWATARSIVNPILMKPKNVSLYIPQVDGIALEFIERIKKLRNPKTLEVPANFENEVNRWALESTGAIALNTRFGLLNDEVNSKNGELIMAAVKEFFDLVLKVEMESRSVWKFFKTPSYKKIMKVYDTITNIGMYHVQEAKKRIEDERKRGVENEGCSILAQLLDAARTENEALVNAMDLLFAGVDTTSAALLTTLYYLAKNPEQQERLKEEVLRTLPQKDSVLSEENMKNLPYLRAVLKEVQRISPVVMGTSRVTTQDLVLNGYKVPKGTTVFLTGFVSSKLEKYVDQPDKFLPERWLREHHQYSCPHSKIKSPFVYIPFGFGPRICVGKRFAELELETALLRIIRNFKVEWHYPDVTYRMSIINTPAGDLKFKFIDLNK